MNECYRRPIRMHVLHYLPIQGEREKRERGKLDYSRDTATVQYVDHKYYQRSVSKLASTVESST
jgi:hypothetical protein